MKRGYWVLRIDEIDEGFEHNDDDLNHIVECIQEGAMEGQLWNSDDETQVEGSEPLTN